MIVAHRSQEVGEHFVASLQLLMKDGTEFELHESSHQVDGIGGTTWGGSLVLGSLLDDSLVSDTTIIELGAGTGVSGVMAAVGNHRASVILTDQEIDLCTTNATTAMHHATTSSSSIRTHVLSWGEQHEAQVLAQLQGSYPSIILCAEVACLVKRQDKLVSTIAGLAGPKTVILVTFDDVAETCSQYENLMNTRMQTAGFQRAVVCTAKLQWQRSSSSSSSSSSSQKCRTSAIMEDITAMHTNDLSRLRLSFPSLRQKLSTTIPSVSEHDKQQQEQHHITCYYKPSATSVCARCQRTFFSVFNRETSESETCNGSGCRYHAGFYVCRKHPAEIRYAVLTLLVSHLYRIILPPFADVVLPSYSFKMFCQRRRCVGILRNGGR